MASRENQGLHIALILLVMLTIGLCLLSFVFYSKAENRSAELEDAKNRLTTAQSDLATAGFKSQTLVKMISGKGKTWEEVEQELANIPGASTDDPELNEIRRNFQNNMKLFPAQLAGEETAVNYQSLPGFLLSRIRDLNVQLADLRKSEQDLTQEKLAKEAWADNVVKQAQAERDKARQDLADERAKFDADRTALQTSVQGLETDVQTKNDKIAQLEGDLQKQTEDFNKRVTELTSTVDNLRLLKNKFEQTSFEVPDGIVTTVNQKDGIVYLNIGSADNLKPQQTFSVYDKDMTGVMDAKSKGRIEVLQILGTHLSMARILEDSVSNLIVPNDVVFTPVWSPGERIHFTIAGTVDVTGSGQDETQMLKRLIELNGGVVDDEVSVQTRYLVQGEKPMDSNEATVSGDDFDKKLATAIEIGVDRLSTQKLLALMGWRADVSTVTLGTGSGRLEGAAEEVDTSPFRQRTPPRGGDGAF